MIFSLLYHRIGVGKNANSLDMLERHLRYIASHFHTVHPGDAVEKYRRHVCLTFDDASFDFYHYLFPLIQELNIKALLAIPTQFILESTTVDASTRLSIPYSQAMQGTVFATHAPFCTWQELKIMAQCPLLTFASHSLSHQNLLSPHIDLTREIVESKKILEEKLSRPINTFVYPMGRFDRAVHAFVKEHYPYVMRIGTTFNTSWQNQSELIYRIICDRLQEIDDPFRWKRFMTYSFNYLVHSLRKR